MAKFDFVALGSNWLLHIQRSAPVKLWLLYRLSKYITRHDRARILGCYMHIYIHVHHQDTHIYDDIMSICQNALNESMVLSQSAKDT